MVCLTQTVHLSWIKISTISKRTELSLEPRHRGVPSGASKTISMPMVRSTQTMHQSCVNISTTSKQTELSLEPRHLGVPSGASKMISKPMEHLAQTVHLSCVNISTVSKRTELSLEPRPLGVPLGASKMSFEPMVYLAQTVHLSCTDPNTVSKRKEVRFHMTHMTQEFHRVHPILFPSLWYVWRKPYTYLVSRLALSLKRLKRASTWTSSPSGTIECIQNDFRAYGMSSANHAPILHWHPTLSPNGEKREFTWPTWARSSIRCVQNIFPSLSYVWRKPCTNLASRLALSLNGPNFHLSLVPRSTSGAS
jgi:hypothetical protein